MMSSHTSALCIVVITITLAILRRFLRPSRAPLPPGPKSLPFIGNALDWPKEEAWKTFSEWSNIYGDMVYVNLAGQRVVILNDYNLAQELLDRKGADYSDRPFMHMACECVGWKHSLPLSSYGSKVKDYRALIARAIGSKAALSAYTPMQEREVRRFVHRLVDEPNGMLFACTRGLVGAIILSITFGYEAEDDNDALLQLATHLIGEFDEVSTPGRYLVDMFPAIDRLPRWFPGLQFRRIAANMRKTQKEFLDRPYKFVRSQLASGTAQTSIVASQIDKAEVTPEQEHRIKWVATALWGGGNDTTLSAIRTFFLAMTLYPDVQRRAQAEIDSVMGPACLPTLDDWPRLPYVEATFLEVLRWGQVAPQGIPHVSRKDDIHRGYLIPKGTLVIPNIWGLGHDPRSYLNPLSFEPERFLKKDMQSQVPDPRDYVFGFGRRICPGQQLAEQTLWLTCATSLAALTISNKSNVNGSQPIIPDVQYIGHLITQPKEFPCVVTARSPMVEKAMWD